MNKNMYNYEIL